MRDRRLIKRVTDIENARRRSSVPPTPTLHFFESIPLGATLESGIGTGVILLCPIHAPLRMLAKVLTVQMRNVVSAPTIAAALYEARIVSGAKGRSLSPNLGGVSFQFVQRIGSYSQAGTEDVGRSKHIEAGREFDVDPSRFPWLGLQVASADDTVFMSGTALGLAGTFLQSQFLSFAGQPLPQFYGDWPAKLSLQKAADASGALGGVAFTLRSAIGARMYGDTR